MPDKPPFAFPRRASVPSKRLHPSSSASGGTPSAYSDGVTALVTPGGGAPPGGAAADLEPRRSGSAGAVDVGLGRKMSADEKLRGAGNVNGAAAPAGAEAGDGAKTSAGGDAKAPANAAAGSSAAGTAAKNGKPGQPVKKARKPYTISRQRENWTVNEHQLFLDALKKYGRSWKQIEAHVRTKNVIQIRSHAQKYFLKLQKNNVGEHVPPPRPKRRSAQNVANGSNASASPSVPSTATPPGSASGVVPQPFGASLQGNPHAAAAAAYAAAHHLAQSQQQQVQQGNSLGHAQPTANGLNQGGQGQGHMVVPSQQQQQFAAAVQHHLQLFQFGSLPHASNPFFAQHPLQSMHTPLNSQQGQPSQAPSGGPGAPRPSAAKAISPRLPVGPRPSAPATDAPGSTGQACPPATSTVTGSVSGPLGLSYPIISGGPGNMNPNPYAFGGVLPNGATVSQSLQTSVPQQLFNQQRPLTQLNPMLAGSAGSIISDASLQGSGAGNGSGSIPTPSPVRDSSAPSGVGNRPSQSAAPVATANDAAATGASSGSPVSPNFTRIYGFFAELFNPLVPKIVEEIVSSVESSTLDCEIIKLLVRNLEVNLSNDVFRQQLTQTYRDQQITQQQQHEQQIAEQAEQQLQAEDNMLWLAGTGSGETGG